MDLTGDLKRFTEHCLVGFAQRYLAAQKDAYSVILSCCKESLDRQEAALTTTLALAALTDGQPDLLDTEGQRFLLDILRKYRADSAVTRAAILTVRHCCLKHEQNRQDLVSGGVLALLTGAITQHSECAELVKEASVALRVMTFDDDVRVTFGHAHEHAKIIVLEHGGLKVLIDAAKGEDSWHSFLNILNDSSLFINVFVVFLCSIADHLENTPVLSELCATLSRLAVRNEFCQDICDLGGLKLIMTLLADSYESSVIGLPERLSHIVFLLCSLIRTFDCRSWFGRS